MAIDILLLILGLGVLIGGGEFLVKGAVGLAASLNISPLIIGMTVVAFGTSAPELIVSINSALMGNPGIALGNVLGSNIANLALVLGATTIIFPIVVNKQVKSIDYPMMFIATGLLVLFALDGVYELYDGIVLFGILVFFLLFLIRMIRKKKKRHEQHHLEKDDDDDDDDDDEEEDYWDDDYEEEFKKEPYWKSMFFLLLGFIGLYFGSEWFVDGAVGIADYFLQGTPDKDVIIGVTVVAFGTSAPELVASTMAAYKRETDISLGNLIGSNIFNIFAVIGITSMVKPIPVAPAALAFDYWWVGGIALLLLFMLYFGKKIGRLKGAILLSTYVAYIIIIVMKVKGLL